LSEELLIPVILGGYAVELGAYAFSGRSRGGVDLYATLKNALACVAVNYGGHQAAVGMKIPEGQVAAVTDLLREKASLITPDPMRIRRMYAAQLRPSSVRFDLWRQVNSLEPYGPDNEAPTFVVRDAELELRRSTSRPNDAYGLGKGRDEKNEEHTFPVIVHDKPQLASISSIRGDVFGRLLLKDSRRGASICFQIEDIAPSSKAGIDR
jgi:single-stranded DNA-specific DHH superfamily exonuclease